MRFSEFIQNLSEIKGFQRQFNQHFQDMPPYVSHQIYTNRFAPHLRKTIGNSTYLAPTVASTGAEADTAQTTVSPMSMLHNSEFSNIVWNKKPQMIHVSPVDFLPETISLFQLWKFGYKPSDKVRNDAERFDTQRKILANQKSNEPIIVVQQGNKYKLIEGVHRTVTILLKGAPPDQVQAVMDGQTPDYNRWQRVPIIAYVGYPRE